MEKNYEYLQLEARVAALEKEVAALKMQMNEKEVVDELIEETSSISMPIEERPDIVVEEKADVPVAALSSVPDDEPETHILQVKHDFSSQKKTEEEPLAREEASSSDDKSPFFTARSSFDGDSGVSSSDENSTVSSSSLENRIGKYVLPIAASVLIFVALCLFGSLIQSSLTPTVKAVAMAVVSVAISVFGLVKMKKESKSYTFYAAVAGCGVGACYVSALVSYFALDVLPLTGLMSCVLIWIAIVTGLSRYKSRMFMVICYLGIVISTILCIAKWSDSSVGLALYLVSITALYFANYSRDYKQVFWLFAQFPICCGLLMHSYASNNAGFWNIVALMVAVYAVMLVQIKHYYQKDNDLLHKLVTVLSSVTTFIGYLLLCDYYDLFGRSGNYAALLSVMMSAAYLAFDVYLYRNISSWFKTWSVVLAIILPNLYYGEFYGQWIGYALPAILLIALGLYKWNRLTLIGGMVYLLWMVTDSPDRLPDACVYLLFVLPLVAIGYRLKENKDDMVKLSLTFMGVVALILPISYDWVSWHFIMLFLTVASMLMAMPWYVGEKNQLGSTKFSVCAFSFNEFLYFIALMAIKNCDSRLAIGLHEFGTSTWSLMLLILCAAALVARYLAQGYRQDLVGEVAVSIYTCAKLTIFAYIVLDRFCTLSYVFSLVGLVLAVIAVVVGFYYHLRGARLYGLVLTLLCTWKLLFYDVHFDNQWYRPVSILAAGLILLFISWLYYRLEGKNIKGKKDTSAMED